MLVVVEQATNATRKEKVSKYARHLWLGLAAIALGACTIWGCHLIGLSELHFQYHIPTMLALISYVMM
jgi:hypothetical protein